MKKLKLFWRKLQLRSANTFAFSLADDKGKLLRKLETINDNLDYNKWLRKKNAQRIEDLKKEIASLESTG